MFIERGEYNQALEIRLFWGQCLVGGFRMKGLSTVCGTIFASLLLGKAPIVWENVAADDLEYNLHNNGPLTLTRF